MAVVPFDLPDDLDLEVVPRALDVVRHRWPNIEWDAHLMIRHAIALSTGEDPFCGEPAPAWERDDPARFAVTAHLMLVIDLDAGEDVPDWDDVTDDVSQATEDLYPIGSRLAGNLGWDDDGPTYYLNVNRSAGAYTGPGSLVDVVHDALPDTQLWGVEETFIHDGLGPSVEVSISGLDGPTSGQLAKLLDGVIPGDVDVSYERVFSPYARALLAIASLAKGHEPTPDWELGIRHGVDLASFPREFHDLAAIAVAVEGREGTQYSKVIAAIGLDVLRAAAVPAGCR